MRRLPLLALLASAACAHSHSSLADLAQEQLDCREDVVVLDVRRTTQGHDYRAYCLGNSWSCTEQNDTATCTAEQRVLATDAERARVSTTDRTLQVSGDGPALSLRVNFDAGRSRVTMFGFPRSSSAALTWVVDSRARQTSREECAFTLITDGTSAPLTRSGYERTDYGERITLSATVEAMKALAAAQDASVRVCEEQLPIERVDREAVTTFIARFESEHAQHTP